MYICDYELPYSTSFQTRMAQIVDQAKEALDVNKDGDLNNKDVEAAVTMAKEAGAKAMTVAQEAFAKAQSEGFFSHFMEYNQEILEPLKHSSEFSVEAAKTEVIATLMLKPANPKNGFKFYNVLALLVGVVESLLMLLLGHGPLSFVWNAGMGYCIAYTLYWVFICKQTKEMMFYGLCFIALYILFSAYMCFTTLIYIVPGALYGAKALIDVLQFINAFEMYKPIAMESGKLML